MSFDTAIDASPAAIGTAPRSGAPRLLGDCVSELASVLLASHPQATALRMILADPQQSVRLLQRPSPRSRR
jgi:hypothetical protein